jgi:hypothetical protein
MEIRRMFEIYWSATRAGMDMARTGLRLGETLAASGTVIERRLELIRAAAADPLAGDYRELGLMVPEKIEAFAKAGAALSEIWWAAQRDMAAHLGHLTAMMLKGGTPTPADVRLMGKRGARGAARAASGPGAALAPIHKAATANARRLGKGARGGPRKG